MFVPRARLLFPAALGSVGFFAACAPPAPVYPQLAVSTMPFPMPAARPLAPRERAKLAVLPLEDDELFRAERAALRFELAGYISRLAPEYEIVPLAMVDSRIRPVSRVTGHRCAFEGEPVEKRARDEGWLTTDLVHVVGLPQENRGETLWVRFVGHDAPEFTLEAPWNGKLGAVDRYRAAFAALTRSEGASFVGGLLGMMSNDMAAREGPMTICEIVRFGQCDPGSAAWQDKAGEVASCFAGEDDVTRDMLVQGDAAGVYCEMENLDATDGRDGAREACACRALVGSAGMRAKPGRRTVRLHYEATDLVGKPRPELRVVESSTNLDAEATWHSIRSVVDGKTQYHSVRRLEVADLDALAAPLSRCQGAAGSVIVVDVDIREDGAPLGGKIVAGAPADHEAVTCIENALGRGAFACTNDGKQARVRIAIQMAPK